MFRLASLILVCLPALAWSQTALNSARPDPISQTSSSNLGFQSFIQFGITCLVLFGLIKWLLPKIKKQLGGSLGRDFGRELEILESKPCGTANLHIVRVRGKDFLLATTPQSAQLITTLEKEDVEEYVPFFETLDNACIEDRREDLLRRIKT